MRVLKRLMPFHRSVDEFIVERMLGPYDNSNILLTTHLLIDPDSRPLLQLQWSGFISSEPLQS